MKDKDFFTEFVIHNVTMLNENDKESAQLPEEKKEDKLKTQQIVKNTRISL